MLTSLLSLTARSAGDVYGRGVVVGVMLTAACRGVGEYVVPGCELRLDLS